MAGPGEIPPGPAGEDNMPLLQVPDYLVFRTPNEVSETLIEVDPKVVAIDTETNSQRDRIRLLEDQIVCWSMAFWTGTEYVRGCCTRYSLQGLVDYFRAKWKTARLVFHNLPFDTHMLENAGIRLYDWFRPEQLDDTMIMDCLYNPNGAHDLKTLAKDRLGILYKSFRENPFKLVLGMTLPEDLMDYAALDALATLWLRDQLVEGLKRECRTKVKLVRGQEIKNLQDYYRVIEQPLTKTLYKACRRGTQLDAKFLEDLVPDLNTRCSELTREICALAGEVVNPNSTPQLIKLLFEKLNYTSPEKSKTKKGAQSTDEEVLEKLEVQRPGIPGKILKFRKIRLLKSTYAEGLHKRMVDSRAHTSMKQHTSTGRLASANPNLQNIPAHPKAGEPDIREAFIATPGHKLLVFDYSQVELRVLAHISGAQSLLKPLCSGEDLHARTASEIFQDYSYEMFYAAKKAKVPTPEQEDLQEKRGIAKTINFGTVYGLSPYGLMCNLRLEGLDVDYDEAREYLNRYWRTHADLKDFLDRLVNTVNNTGYVPTLLGRMRPIGKIFPGNGRVNKNAKNEATNTPVQGSAAELVKLKMIELDSDPVFVDDLEGHLLLQVHDELLLEVPEENAMTAFDYVKKVLETPPVPLSVPLLVDGKIVKHWGEGH